MAKAGLPSGTRDFLPEKLIFRQKVIATIKEVFERYGFLPLETPAMERLDVLSGKYGEEADKLIFKILKRGDELKEAIAKGEELADMGLRYDLTVPLCRVIAMHQNEIDFPFRRYQIQPVWRAERAQKGRYREFYQCDADIVGQEAPLPDAELVALTYEVLTALGFTEFVIRYNHRLLLSALAEKAMVPENKHFAFFTILDKLDKIGFGGLRDELKKLELSESSIGEILSIIELGQGREPTREDLDQKFNEFPEKWVRAYSQIVRMDYYAVDLGVPRSVLHWDISLARGLDYYTGPIFEVGVPKSGIGSICGGGRYDNLVGTFLEGRPGMPAAGISFGLERIIDLLSQKAELTFQHSLTTIVVIPYSADLNLFEYVLEVAKDLRSKRIATEIFPAPHRDMKYKFGWASKRKIPFVAIVGPDEIKERQVAFKNMTTGQQSKLPFGQLPPELKSG